MMMELSDTYSCSLDLTAQLTCDFSMTEAAIESHSAEGPSIYNWIRDKLPSVWGHLAAELPDNQLITLTLSSIKHFSFSILLVTNEEIRTLNRDFRGKDSETDVLTFTLVSDNLDKMELDHLPELNLGEIYISLDWAKGMVCKQLEENLKQTLNFSWPMTLFVLERLVHGILHLLGVHHNTMPDYNKVTEIQRLVIYAVT